MTKKSLLWVGTLALFSLAVASAKSYDIALPSPAKVGTTQLAAGKYTLKVEGSNAVFKNLDNGKTVTVAFQSESVAKKYDQTAVGMSEQKDGEHLKFIELGGSKTKLEFR